MAVYLAADPPKRQKANSRQRTWNDGAYANGCADARLSGTCGLHPCKHWENCRFDRDPKKCEMLQRFKEREAKKSAPELEKPVTIRDRDTEPTLAELEEMERAEEYERIERYEVTK